MKSIKLFLRLFSKLLITILAADLLYGWVIGGWYDPIKAIEYSEVALLVIFCFWGVFLLIKEMVVCSGE